ncbi:DNA kinase/phosphatase Pnk1 [Microbotryomycetes sp. JL201]|nr:DNA kinase/phosphatase Pnk1 [Microbotryomycetes sp. JL201]
MSTSNHKRCLPSPPLTSPDASRKQLRREPAPDSQKIDNVSVLTWLPMLGQHETCLVAQTRQFKFRSKIAMFDFVPTVIGLPGGQSDPSESFTFNEGVIDKMLALQGDQYSIVLYACFVCIFSENKMNQQRDLFNVIAIELSSKGVDFRIYGACKRDEWWKPSPCVWYHVLKCLDAEGIGADVTNSFHCGTRAGRTYKDRLHAPKPDSTDYDRCFALNTGLRFISPQDLFQGGDMEHTWSLKSWDPAIWQHDRPLFDPTNTALVFKQVRDEFRSEKPIMDVTIAVGPPASGKTFLFDHFFKQAAYARVTSDATQRHSPLWKALSGSEVQHVYVDMLLPTLDSRRALIDTIRSLSDELETPFKLQFRLLVFTAPWCIVKHNSVYRSLSRQVDLIRTDAGQGRGELINENETMVVTVTSFIEWFSSYQESNMQAEAHVDEIKQINFTVLDSPTSNSHDGLQFPRRRELWLKFLDVYGMTTLDKQEPGAGGSHSDRRLMAASSGSRSKS